MSHNFDESIAALERSEAQRDADQAEREAKALAEHRSEWSTFVVRFRAKRSEGFLKVGESTYFEASSIEEVREKMLVRALDASEVQVTRVDHVKTWTDPQVVIL